jgi:uncharacterized membrane protein (UPF0127 family)
VARRTMTISRPDGHVVCTCVLADTPLKRLRGLLGRSALPAGEGLLLRPSPSIHTFFMRFAIDAVFLDRDLRVVAIERALGPGRVAGKRGARAVLELAAGEAARRGVCNGDTLRLTPAGGAG